MQEIAVQTLSHSATKSAYFSMSKLKGCCHLKAAFFLFFLVACQSAPIPVQEYTLARAAMEAAKSVEAARYSSGNWHQAEEAYRQGELSIQERDYLKATEQFKRARVAAERAENAARLIRQKNGEVL